MSLFGYPPPTLAALEQPYLLPTANSEERTIQEFGLRMRRMHLRLTRELDDLKDAETRLVPPSKPLRTLLPGDKVWLKYSDSEKARYLRKHGKGLAWRHAFTVLAVKPHAVLLERPPDGSVPDVLPWQSLRKCSFAAPFFHDPELVLPDVDEHALPMAPEVETPAPHIHGHATADFPALPVDDMPDEWHEWSEGKLYDIESIVSAEPSGRGWKLRVKWDGHPTVTTERLSSIVSRVTDQRILDEIESRKAEYRSQYTTAPPPPELAVATTTTPTRVQPTRSSRIQSLFILSTDDAGDDPILFDYACSMLCVESGKRTQSLYQLEDVL